MQPDPYGATHASARFVEPRTTFTPNSSLADPFGVTTSDPIEPFSQRIVVLSGARVSICAIGPTVIVTPCTFSQGRSVETSSVTYVGSRQAAGPNSAAA